MNKLFALILVAGAITFSSCKREEKKEESKDATAPAKTEEAKPAVTEEKADTSSKKADKKVPVIEEEKKDAKK